MAAAKKPKAESKSDTKKLDDVAQPGSVTPDATSRPIIVTNRPVLQDPMVVEAGDGAAKPVSAPTSSRVTIKPISITSADDSADEPVTSTNNIKADSHAPSEPPISEEETESPVPAQEEPQSSPETDVKKSEEENQKGPEDPKEAEASEESADDADDSGPKAQSPEEIEAAAKQAEEQEAERLAAIQKLAESKEYYLPIATVEERQTKRFLLLGAVLILVLGAAWLDVALDAGLVRLGGIKPVTHFFAHQQTATVAAPATPKTPTVTYQTFSLPVAKLSLRYPSDWKFDNSASTAQNDTLSLQPKVAPLKSPSGLNVIFLSLPVANPQSPSTLKSVHYQKLTHQLDGKTVYLVDLIYQDAAGNVSLTSSLTNDNTLKAGQKTAVLQQNFTNADGKSNYFGITVPPVSAGKNALATVTDTQSLLGSHQYQQARAILLSVATAKS